MTACWADHTIRHSNKCIRAIVMLLDEVLDSVFAVVISSFRGLYFLDVRAARTVDVVMRGGTPRPHSSYLYQSRWRSLGGR